MAQARSVLGIEAEAPSDSTLPSAVGAYVIVVPARDHHRGGSGDLDGDPVPAAGS
ncbi:MAG: hypothetical protein AAF242_01845 [Bacteroidota bacterium]